MLIVLAGAMLSSCGIVNYTAAKIYKKNIAEAPYDAIIIPGNPFDSTKTNHTLIARVYWAKILYDKGIARNIIFSGAAVHTPFVEAMAMKMMADSMGIPPENTFIEQRALHSTENVDYGVELADSLGFKKLAVATDPFQSLFLSLHIKDRKLKVSLLPYSKKYMQAANQTQPHINYQVAYVQNFVPLKERNDKYAAKGL